MELLFFKSVELEKQYLYLKQLIKTMCYVLKLDPLWTNVFEVLWTVMDLGS